MAGGTGGTEICDERLVVEYEFLTNLYGEACARVGRGGTEGFITAGFTGRGLRVAGMSIVELDLELDGSWLKTISLAARFEVKVEIDKW